MYSKSSIFSQFVTKNIAIPFEKMTVSHCIKDILEKYNIKLKISAYDNNAVDKPVIVFIHGIGVDKEAFMETGVLSAFFKSHHVIAIDLPGHGQSTMLDQLTQLHKTEQETLAEALYSMPSVIDQVAWALQALNIENATVFGWSLGGHIAHGLAIKYPALMSRLITCGTPSLNYAEHDKLKDGFSEWFVDNIIPDWINNPGHYSAEDENSMNNERIWGAESIMGSMGYTDVKLGGKDRYIVNSLMQSDPLFRKFVYLTLPKHSENEALYGKNFLESNTKIPVCFIEGEKDGGCVFETLKLHFLANVKDKHPASCLVSFKETGHAVFRAHPKEFVSTINEFIKQTDRLCSNNKERDIIYKNN